MQGSEMSGLGLVNKGAPHTMLAQVQRAEYEALRDFVVRGRESRVLLDFLDQLHARSQWILCDCLEPSTPLVERPALTVARSPKSKLYLRNLISRKNHASHCIFKYTASPRNNQEVAPTEYSPASLSNGLLNLHRAQADGMAKEVKGTPTVRLSKSNAPYPRLGQVMLHLMRESGMLRQNADFEFLAAIKACRVAASQMLAFPATRLDEVLYLSVRQEQQMIDKVASLRQRVNNAYGVLMVIVHRIEQRPLTLIRENKSGPDWRCTPQGEVKIIGRRSISKGPFMAAITYAPNNGEDAITPQHAFVVPIMSNSRPLPVESDLERQVATGMARFIEWADKSRNQTFVIDKPMYDISVEEGMCRPDFLVQGPGGQVVVEVMGMMDDAEYRERKERTVPLMAMLGEVLEIAPAPGMTIIAPDQIKELNRAVLRLAGAKR